MRATATMSLLAVVVFTTSALTQADTPQPEISSLIGDLRSQKSLRRYDALEALSKLGPAARQAGPELEMMLVDGDELVRVLAAAALGRVEPENGQRTQSAIQVLVRTMRGTSRSEIRREAANALVVFDAMAVAETAEALGDRRPETRILAAEALARIGAAAGEAVPTLISLLDDEDAKVRTAAAHALGRIGQSDRLAIPALALRLQDSNAIVRAAAAEALGEFGPAAKDAANALAKVLQDHEPNCCRSAASALERLGKHADVATPELIDVLGHDNHAASAHAACALANVGGEAVPLLIKAMKSDKARYWAMMALAEMGAIAKPAVPSLVNMLADEDPNVRRDVLLCLGGIGSGAAESVAAILERLKDNDPSVQQAAAFALGNLGSHSNHTVDALIRALESDNSLLGVVAARSLLRLDGLDESTKNQAQQHLLARADHPDLPIRVAVIKAFGEIPATTEAMQATLIRSLRMSEPPAVTSAASDTLVQLGKPAVRPLVSALRDGETQLGALIILGRIGPKSQAAVPAIAHSVNHPDPKIRHAALISLGQIGPGAQAAIGVVEKALRDSDSQVRDAAAFALQAINANAAKSQP